MATTDASVSAPAPAPPALPASAPRVVLVGLPSSGKTALLGALSHAAESQSPELKGRLVDPSGALAAMRKRATAHRAAQSEIAVYPIEFHPEPPEEGGEAPSPWQALLVDCDGRYAAQLLTVPEGDTRVAPAAYELRAADAVLLVVDAAASPEGLDQVFGQFARFLQELETQRGQGLEVGGLPVYLVLAKCDKLAREGDSAIDWIEHVEQRKREIADRFKAFLKRRAGGLERRGFGWIDLRLWATAAHKPPFEGATGKPGEPYGVAELFGQCLEEAHEFQERENRSRRRLAWIVGGAAGLVGLMAGLMLALFSATPSDQSVEKTTPAQRLEGSVLQLEKKLASLKAQRDAAGFETLPASRRDDINFRIKELEEYLPYYKKVLQTPWAGETDTEQGLRDLKRTFERDLAPPHDDWTGTPAVVRQQQRIQEIDAMQDAIELLRPWYQRHADRLRQLATLKDYKEPINWPQYQHEIDNELKSAKDSPFADNESVPGVTKELTYALVRKVDAVREARKSFENWLKKALQVRDVASALGLINLEPGREPPLVIFGGKPPTLEQVKGKLATLQSEYPDLAAGVPATELPGVMRQPVNDVAADSVRKLMDTGRGVVLQKLRADGRRETPESWKNVQRWLDDPKELAEWRQLVNILNRLRTPAAPDPVSELAAFLDKRSFTIALNEVRLDIPFRSVTFTPLPNAAISIYHPRTAGEGAALALKLDEDRTTRDFANGIISYFFKQADDKTVTYRPGDEFSASLVGNGSRMLSWAIGNRSAMYQFERLAMPPRLHSVTMSPEQGSREDRVTLTVLAPPNGLPRVPDLMPDATGP
jgi:hypothetical protein